MRRRVYEQGEEVLKSGHRPERLIIVSRGHCQVVTYTNTVRVNKPSFLVKHNHMEIRNNKYSHLNKLPNEENAIFQLSRCAKAKRKPATKLWLAGETMEVRQPSISFHDRKFSYQEVEDPKKPAPMIRTKTAVQHVFKEKVILRNVDNDSLLGVRSLFFSDVKSEYSVLSNVAKLETYEIHQRDLRYLPDKLMVHSIQ